MKNIKINEGMSYGLFSEGHLGDEGQALAADALALGRIEDLPQAVREHLGECQACRETVMELYRILYEDGSLPEEEHHPFFRDTPPAPDLSKRTSNRWLKYAAIILLLAVPGAVLILNSSRWSDASFSRWISGIFGRETIDPFAPHPELEPMTLMVFRNTGLMVETPLVGDTLRAGRVAELRYQGLAAEELDLVVLDNQGQEQLSTKVSGGSAQLSFPTEPGRYYWKLSGGGELLHIGVVVVAD